MAAWYYDKAGRDSAAVARPAARKRAAVLGLTIEESLDGGWHELRAMAPEGQSYDDGIHEIVIANTGEQTDGLWERMLEALTNARVEPCKAHAAGDCEWCEIELGTA